MLDVQAAWLGMKDPGKVEIDHSLAELEKLQAGSLTANVLHTPGHTEGSICLYFPAEQKLIAGDTLFAGSIGRTRISLVVYSRKSSVQLRTICLLPDQTVVVPGHGPLTSIGEEREINPFLR